MSKRTVELEVATPGLDEITFSVSGTIPLATALPALSDGLVINGLGQNVIIDGGDTVRPFAVNAGIEVTLVSLTVTRGSASGAGPAGRGGAIYNDGGTLSTFNVTLSNNAAAEGGAIYNNGGTLTVMRSTLDGNRNTTAVGGAAVFNNSGSALITGSTVRNHTAGGTSAVFQAGGTLSLLASTLNNNTLSGAGALQVGSGTVEIGNATFNGNSGNTAGAIQVSGGSATISNATIAGNTGLAGAPGGIANSGGAVTLRNTIVANNPNAAATNCSGVITDGGNNLEQVSPGTCGFATAAVFADPLLGPLANNGGATLTMALTGASPAIGTGNGAICTSAPINNHDQRCNGPRSTTCAIGAYDPGATQAAQLASLSMAFGASAVAPGGNTTLTYTFSNGSANFATLSQLGLVNSLPAGLSVGAGLVGGTCTSLPSPGFGATTIQIAGLSLAPGQTCTIVVPILVSTSAQVINTVTWLIAQETGLVGINVSATLNTAIGGGSFAAQAAATRAPSRLPATGFPPPDRSTRPTDVLAALGMASLALLLAVRRGLALRRKR